MIYRTITVLMLTLIVGSASGQTARQIKKRYKSNPPKAILVQLFTYPRKVNYYTKTNQPQKLQRLHAAADEVAKRMVEDFNHNFNFCPVYYYYDTNANNIRNRNFQGVLLDKNLQPATDIVLTPADTNYFLVYNGFLISEDFRPDRDWGKDAVFRSSDVVLKSHSRLVVMDRNFTELPANTVRTARYSTRPRKKIREYHSYKTGLFYEPDAASLSYTFQKFFSRG